MTLTTKGQPMRKIFLALSQAIFGLGLYACAGSPTAPSGMSNDLSNGASARAELAVGNIRQLDNPVDADAVEIGPDGQSVSTKDKTKNENENKSNDGGQNGEQNSNNSVDSRFPSLVTDVASVMPGAGRSVSGTPWQ